MLVVCLFSAPALSASASEASTAISLINQERSSRGLNTLKESGSLSSFALNHSQDMAAAGDIYHSSNLGSAASGWDALGENVGAGGTATSLHGAFMDSPGHRANVLGDWTHIGAGAVIEGGTLYITIVFMKKGSAEVTTTTTVAATPTTQRSVNVTDPTEPPKRPLTIPLPHEIRLRFGPY